MPYFSYQANDAADQPQQGTLAAVNLVDAVTQLETRGLTVLSIALADTAVVLVAGRQKLFHDRLAAAIAHRREWLPALESMARELPASPARRETEKLIQRLSQDRSADEFLQDSAAVALLPLIISGSEAKLGATRIQDWLSEVFRTQEQQVRRRRAWVYPALLAVLVAVLLVVFANFLIPIFREMYDEFGLQLPAPTRWTFWIAEQISIYLLRTLLIGSALVAVAIPGVRLWRKHALTNRILGRLVAGSTANLRGMASLTRTLAELLSIGAPLSEALRIAGRSSRHYGFELAANALATHLTNATSLNAHSLSSQLPPTVVYALRANPDGLPSIPLLRELAKVYADRAQSRRDLLASIFPEVGVVILGMCVGFVMISLFLPLVSMVTSLA